jgi:hypothetical protein
VARLLVVIALFAVLAVARAEEDDDVLEVEPLGPPIPERLESLEREWAEDAGAGDPAEAPRGEDADHESAGPDGERPPAGDADHDDEKPARPSVQVVEIPREGRAKAAGRAPKGHKAEPDARTVAPAPPKAEDEPADEEDAAPRPMPDATDDAQ